MAIKTIVKRDRLKRIGILRKGDPKTKTAPGKDLSYFRFTDGDDLSTKEFNKAYKTEEQKRRINVFLPFATASENFDHWMEEHLAGGMVHRCDGEKTVLVRLPNGQFDTRPQPCPGGCKQVGRLSVVVRELGRIATVTVLTTSINDIANIQDQLNSYEAIFTDLRPIPFILTRKEVAISTPEIVKGQRTGKRMRRKKWLLFLEPEPQWSREKLLSMGNYSEELRIEAETGEVVPHIVELSAIASPDEYPSPTPEPDSNQGNGSIIPKINSPDLLLEAVNAQLPPDRQFNHPGHLGNFLGGFPLPNEHERWEEVYKMALAHKQESTQ